MNTTVFVLLYGDYPQLSWRCLGSLVDLVPQHCLRIGLNDVSPQVQSQVQQLVDSGYVRACDVYSAGGNIHKYPRMRQMLYDPANPVVTDYVMWFDDDSYVTKKDPGWLSDAQAALVDAAVLGSIYTIPFAGQQLAWIKAQPWYTGRPFPEKHGKPYTSFCTGGWWMTRHAFLKQHDWPIPELDHRGGDVMLGALCYQQRLLIKNFRRNLAINADENGRESKSPRRGFDSDPVGYHGPITPSPDDRSYLLNLDL